MKKITKKMGMENLMENTSKLILNGYVTLNRAEDLLDNTEKERYIELTRNVANRIGIKFNNNEIVFEILEGDKQGQKSWLSDLTNTKWYRHKSKNGSFIVIDFSNKKEDFNMVMVYQLT